MNFFSRLFNIFLSPTTTFNDVKQKPSWIVPLVVVIVLTVAIGYFMTPVSKIVGEKVIVDRMEKMGASQEQIDQALEQQAKQSPVIGYASAGVMAAVTLFVTALVWFFVGNTILGGKVTYGQMMGGVVYRYFIILLGSFIKLPIMLQKETIDVHFSPATFMSADAAHTFLYKFLAHFDIFAIWAIAVLCIGIAVLADLPVKKVWPWVVTIFVLFFLASAAIRNLLGF